MKHTTINIFLVFVLIMIVWAITSRVKETYWKLPGGTILRGETILPGAKNTRCEGGPGDHPRWDRTHKTLDECQEDCEKDTKCTGYNYWGGRGDNTYACVNKWEGCNNRDNTWGNWAKKPIISDPVSDSVEGCTDATAFNYDPLANTDDNNCVAVVEGCTTPGMFNFDPYANTGDGSCVSDNTGCYVKDEDDRIIAAGGQSPCIVNPGCIAEGIWYFGTYLTDFDAIVGEINIAFQMKKGTASTTGAGSADGGWEAVNKYVQKRGEWVEVNNDAPYVGWATGRGKIVDIKTVILTPDIPSQLVIRSKSNFDPSPWFDYDISTVIPDITEDTELCDNASVVCPRDTTCRGHWKPWASNDSRRENLDPYDDP